MSIIWDENPTPEAREREEAQQERAALRQERIERQDAAEVLRTPEELAQLERERYKFEPGWGQPDPPESEGQRRRRESIRQAYEELASERNSR